ncbi:L,D-transpeptidase family protein [Ligilactobacillus equi]
MKKKSFIATGIAVVALGIAGGAWYSHQQTYFNQNTYINGVNVSGKSASQALAKLEKAKVANELYVGNKRIYKGNDIHTGILATDKAKVAKVLQEQVSLLPNTSKKEYFIQVKQADEARSQKLATKLENYLDKENESRQAPVDAYAIYRDDKVSLVKEKAGNTYDVKKMMQDFQKQADAGVIKVARKEAKPLTTDSKTVQKQKTNLESLVMRKVTYKVQDKDYELNAKDLITSASYKGGQLTFDTSKLANQIKDINAKQATLGKSFNFKTTGGSEITVQDGSYGWKISEAKAKKTLLAALQANKASVNAKADIYGTGFYDTGTGYDVTAANGIGDTYAEVSISQQMAWFYKNGTLITSLPVVTGNVSDGSSTPIGVHYIGYKQSPTVLRGVHSDGSSYASPVRYWAPFTVDGCGFHDASWRHNWSGSAYLNDGSNGCVNIRPSSMATVFGALEQGEPVIVHN